MNVAHIGWNHCPFALRAIYKGKEKYPTIAFQVISSHRRQILYVSKSFPGTCNNKQIVKIMI